MPNSDRLERFIDSNPDRIYVLELIKKDPFCRDLILSRKVIGAIHEELRTIKELYENEALAIGWDNIRDRLVEAWRRDLSKLIDLNSVKRGELQGISPEIVDIIRKIFPKIEHYSVPSEISWSRFSQDQKMYQKWKEPPSKPQIEYESVIKGSSSLEESSKVDASIKKEYNKLEKSTNKLKIIIFIVILFVFILSLAGVFVSINFTPVKNLTTVGHLSNETSTIAKNSFLIRSISGNVFLDENYNGIFDSIDKLCKSVTVNLYNASGHLLKSTTTNISGSYLFEVSAPDNYLISIIVPKGCINSTSSSVSLSLYWSNVTDLNFGIVNLTANPKTVTLKYILRGVSGMINFTVYEGLYKYLLAHPNSTVYYTGKPPNNVEVTTTVTLRYVNEELGGKEIAKLADIIKNITSENDDQARIAISIVQNIPYGDYYANSNHVAYPYEVLYNNMGVCSEKSRLLVCLLKELGYGCAIFGYINESHEAVGIKCPPDYSYYNNYAFVETTRPTIITFWQGEYEGGIKLPVSPDYIIFIADGRSFDSIFEEANDAKLWSQLLSMGRVLDSYHYNLWWTLVNKYGLLYF